MSGRVVVVTGAARGIGRAVVGSFVRGGAQVVCADIEFEGSGSLDVDGCECLAVRVDVTDESDVRTLADAAVERHGRIDVWINNAGIIRPAMLHKMSTSDFDSVMAVHARGTFLGMRESSPRMREHESGGSIINVTSAAGLDGTIGQINYAAAKGAIVAMTKSGARELGRHGIRVNAVAPVAATEMTQKIRDDPKLSEMYLARIPLARWGATDEIAAAFTFLASDAAAYMTGQVVAVDGGMHMAS